MELKESNSSKHFRISVLKSGIRMFGCAALMYNSVLITFTTFYFVGFLF